MSAVVPQKSESALRADLLRNLALLQEDLHALATSVRQHASDWWAWKAPSSAEPGAFDPLPAWERSAAKGHILKAIETIDYEGHQSRVDAMMFPALVCVPQQTRQLVREVNSRKSAFESAARAMSGKVRDEWSDSKQRLERLSLLRYALRRAGAAHVNYWHAVREFVVFEHQPRLVSYTWVHSQEISTRSVADLREDLHQQAASGSQAELVLRDLKRLGALHDTELLARKVTWTAHPRVNLVFEAASGTQRMMRRASLPIFLPGERLPMFRPLSAAPLPKGFRAKRSDSRLEAEPFLESVPYHRFRTPAAMASSLESD